MTDLTRDWFVGFIEGEGNFNVALANMQNHKPKYPFEKMPVLQFRIFLREDDLEVLQKIKNFLGFGKIYKKSMEANRRLGFKSMDQYTFYVTHSRDLLKLKEILSTSQFHTKKAKDMESFFKILDLKLAKKHLISEGYEEILKLATNMNSKNRQNFKPGNNRKIYRNRD